MLLGVRVYARHDHATKNSILLQTRIMTNNITNNVNINTNSNQYPRHSTCLLLGTRKNKQTRITNFCSTPKKTLAPRKSRGRRALLRFFQICTRLRIFALVLRIFALVLHLDCCSLLSNIQRPIILEDRPARFCKKTLEAGRSVRFPYFGDDPWFCNTFGLRAEI